MSLSAAVGSGSLKLIRKLVEDGANVDEPGIDGTTPLCCAAMWGFTEAAETLLDFGAEVNACCPGTGATPLHLAAFQAKGKVIMLLLERGADPHLEDKSGRTPTEYASVSEAIWPLFAARGCARSSKEHLLRIGIIRKLAKARGGRNNAAASRDRRAISDKVDYLSRPGSSYGRSHKANPLVKSTTADSGDGGEGDVLAILGKGGMVERRRNESIGRLGL